MEDTLRLFCRYFSIFKFFFGAYSNKFTLYFFLSNGSNRNESFFRNVKKLLSKLEPSLSSTLLFPQKL